MKYFKYIFWTLLVIVPCVVTVLIYNDKITQNAPVFYRQGVKFYNEGNYSDAYYNFSKIKWISPLYPISLYKQAKSTQKIGDYRTASLKYEMFLKKMPDSIFSTNARLNLAKSYFYLKQFDEAKIQFEKLAQAQNNDGTEEIFFLGLINKNTDKQKSYEYFKRYLASAIQGDAVNKYYISASAQELANLGVELSNDDKKLIGIAYFKEHRYKDALDYFSKLPVNKCWDYFVLSNYYSGNKVIAKKLIDEGIVLYAQFSEENNLHDIYNIYTSYQTGNRLKNWINTEQFVKDNNLKGNDYVLYKLAEIAPKDKSITFYREIYQNYPDSKYSAEALWCIIWNAYKRHDYISVEKLSTIHLHTYKKVKSTPKVLFWLGKIYLKQNKISEANSVFNKLITRYPDDYYGLRASFLMDNNDFWKTSQENKLPVKNEEIDFPISISDMDLKNLKIINTLFEVGDYEVWIDADFANPLVESWFEFKKGKKSRSIVLARDEIAKMEIKEPIESTVYKLAYPIYMPEEINISGEKLGIDPFLIASIIREESYYNEEARSKTGAIGLMQLMPQTANYMIDKLDISNTADIQDARTNLYLGCNYLKYLKNRFNNDLYVIAAYNGGEGSVLKWEKNFKSDDYDEFIEDIPFEETRLYVKKVFRTYQMYKKIYT